MDRRWNPAQSIVAIFKFIGVAAASLLCWGCDPSPPAGIRLAETPDRRVELKTLSTRATPPWTLAAIESESGEVLNTMRTEADPYRCAVGSAGQIAALSFPEWNEQAPIQIAISIPGRGVIVTDSWEDPPPPTPSYVRCKPSRFFPVVLPESGDVAVVRSLRCALADRNCLADSCVRVYSSQDGRIISEHDLFDGAGPVPGKVVAATGVPGTNCIAIMLWPRRNGADHLCDASVPEPIEFGLVRSDGEVVWRDCLDGKGMGWLTDVYRDGTCWMGVGPKCFGYRNAMGESRILSLKTDEQGVVVSVEHSTAEPPGYMWEVPDRFKSKRTRGWDLPNNGYEGRE